MHESGCGIVEVSSLLDMSNKDQGYLLTDQNRKKLLSKIWGAVHGDYE